jgi:AcrR family transcriptional regulator
MDQISDDTGGRGSPESWLEGAYEALLESGVDSVKILPLSKRLGLSRTSFYWFFKEREELLSALISRWREKNTGNIIKQSEAYAESLTEALLNVFDCWLDKSLFDSQFEFAVRSWALQSAEILAEVQKADQLRLDALRRMLIRFGHNEKSADVRARTIYLIQIGYISMQTNEDLRTRMNRIPEYVEIFAGRAPEQRELDRFFARHAYSATQAAASGTNN